MAWTKRALIEQAFGELALAGYIFDITPEELQAALVRLDTMMATWAAQGVVLPYALTVTPNTGDIDGDSGLPLVAVEAVYMGLATRLAAGKGKALPPSSLKAAKEAYNSLLTVLAHQQVTPQQFPSGTPLGAGNKPWRLTTRPFVSRPDTSPVRIAQDGGLDLGA